MSSIIYLDFQYIA